MSSLADNMVMMRILKMLVTPFEKTDAFKLGIIDKDGNRIKKPSTSDEKDAYNYLTRFVFNLKKLFAKRNGKDENKLAHMMFLVKESNVINGTEEHLLDEDYIESLIYITEDLEFVFSEEYSLIISEISAAPTNTTAIIDGHRNPPMNVGELGILTRDKTYKDFLKSISTKKMKEKSE